jgi:hypothetical protein
MLAPPVKASWVLAGQFAVLLSTQKAIPAVSPLVGAVMLTDVFDELRSIFPHCWFPGAVR